MTYRCRLQTYQRQVNTLQPYRRRFNRLQPYQRQVSTLRTYQRQLNRLPINQKPPLEAMHPQSTETVPQGGCWRLAEGNGRPGQHHKDNCEKALSFLQRAHLSIPNQHVQPGKPYRTGIHKDWREKHPFLRRTATAGTAIIPTNSPCTLHLPPPISLNCIMVTTGTADFAFQHDQEGKTHLLAK